MSRPACFLLRPAATGGTPPVDPNILAANVHAAMQTLPLHRRPVRLCLVGRGHWLDSYLWVDGNAELEAMRRLLASMHVQLEPAQPPKLRLRAHARLFSVLPRRLQMVDSTPTEALTEWLRSGVQPPEWCLQVAFHRLPGFLTHKWVSMGSTNQEIASTEQAKPTAFRFQPGSTPRVVATWAAGAESWADAQAVCQQLAANLPGTAASTMGARPVRDWPMGAALIALAVALEGAARHWHLSAAGLATVLAALTGILLVVLHPRHRLFARAFARGRVPLRPRMALLRSALLPVAGPINTVGTHRCGLTAFQLGALLRAAAISDKPSLDRPPREAIECSGPAFGQADGQWVKLAEEERVGGIFCTGAPGSGKTTVLTLIWAHDMAHRRSQATPPHSLWIETKGPGAERAWHLAKSAGVTPRVVSANDAAGEHLVLVDLSYPHTSAVALASALKYALEVGDIRFQSFEAIGTAFLMAICADTATLPGELTNINIVNFARVLMGAAGTATQRQLLEAVRHQQARSAQPRPPLTAIPSDYAPIETNLAIALGRWEYFMQLPERQRREIFAPPLNKLEVLSSIGTLWDKSGPLSIQSWLASNDPLIVNISSEIPSSLAHYVSSILLYMLWHNISYTCQSWGTQGRFTDVFCDELASLLGSNDDSAESVLAQMYDHGREHGVRLALATQRIEQLATNVRLASLLRSFANQLIFTQSSSAVANTLMADAFGADYTNQGLADTLVMQLPRYCGLARVRYNASTRWPYRFQTVPMEQLPGLSRPATMARPQPEPAR